jgi:hypothetical protein
MAGRNISCSHVAFTSTRVMATCGVAGQAAGTAAAMCIQRGITPRGLYENKQHLAELQQTLLRDDQTIKGRLNSDPLDLARKARVTASGEEGTASAGRIIDGYLRDIPRKPAPETHQWNARLGPEGAWIELAWDQPQRIREVQVTFDTGLQRRLMLSASASVTRGQVRAPQPETVRDYQVFRRTRPEGALTEIVSVKNNYARVRRHRFAPVEASSLRIHIAATNGDDLARIYEVRCYA